MMEDVDGTIGDDESGLEVHAAVSPMASVEDTMDEDMNEGERILDESAADVSPVDESNPAVVEDENWCEICNMRIRKGEESTKNHISGKAHVKKVAGQQVLLRLSQEHDCYEQVGGHFRCMICDVMLTSPQLLETHLNGTKHKKKIKEGDGVSINAIFGHPYILQIANAAETAEKEVEVNMSIQAHVPEEEYPGKLAEVANDDTTQVDQANTQQSKSISKRSKGVTTSEDDNWCEICKIRLQGKVTPELVTSHLEGTKHIKKLANYELILKLRSEETYFDEDPVSGELKCTLCNLRNTTPQQLKDHFVGSKHINKARTNAGITGNNKEEGEVTIDGYWCLVCKLSGAHSPQSIAAHKQGAKHLKKVAANEVLQKLKQMTDCFDYLEETGILRCKMCKTESNTPQLFEVHLNGSKHKMMVEGRPFKRKQDGFNSPAKRLAHNPGNSDFVVEIRNLPSHTQKKNIHEMFGNCGEMERVYFNTRQNKKNWYIAFMDKGAAARALQKNKTVLEEGPMYVSAYHPKERNFPPYRGENQGERPWNNRRRNPVNPSFNDYPEERPMYAPAYTPEEKWDHANENRMSEERWNHNQSRMPEDRWNQQNQRRMPEDRWNQQDQRRMPEERWNQQGPSAMSEQIAMAKRWNQQGQRMPEERWHQEREDFPARGKAMSEEEIQNLSAPHGEIKDVRNLMKKWSFAYYRHLP